MITRRTFLAATAATLASPALPATTSPSSPGQSATVRKPVTRVVLPSAPERATKTAAVPPSAPQDTLPTEMNAGSTALGAKDGSAMDRTHVGPATQPAATP